ncbi:MAG: hypothetical protein ABIF82_11815 [Planctomycetota bacterium]
MHVCFCLAGFLAVLSASSCAAANAQRPAFENLAAEAKITASSEHKAQKLFAPNVADGRFAHKGCGTFEFHPANMPAKSWAVNGETAKDKGVLTFEWTTPVTASRVIYYPRMAWLSR